MKTRALVVDDNADMRLLVRKKLQSLSFEVVEADGVRSAIEQIDIHKFNLIVCDYMMPGGSGLELLTYT